MSISIRTLSIGLAGTLLVGTAAYLLGVQRGGSQKVVLPEGATYTRDGFGGIAQTGLTPKAAQKANPKAKAPAGQSGVASIALPQADPVAPARAAMEKKQYKAAAIAAANTIKTTLLTTSENRRAVLRARKIEGFALARQGKLQEAQTAFKALADEGAKLPEGDLRPAVSPGEWQKPTLREDAVYQHAILTAAQGDKAGAERELNAFIRDFPESPLMIAAVKRISRFHDQNIPAETEKLWKTAMDLRSTKEKETKRLAALCGPKCLVELLRRQGKSADVETLAKAMKTDEEGTTLLALRDEARKQGFSQAQGVELTRAGLKAQSFPIIALLAPQHFVVVEKVSDKALTIWDPGEGKRKDVELESWAPAGMGGIALTLDRVAKG